MGEWKYASLQRMFYAKIIGKPASYMLTCILTELDGKDSSYKFKPNQDMFKDNKPLSFDNAQGLAVQRETRLTVRRGDNENDENQIDRSSKFIMLTGPAEDFVKYARDNQRRWSNWAWRIVAGVGICVSGGFAALVTFFVMRHSNKRKQRNNYSAVGGMPLLPPGPQPYQGPPAPYYPGPNH